MKRMVCKGDLFQTRVLGIAIVFCFLFGCATVPKRPDWVTKGSGAFLGEKAFYGVGAVAGVRNLPVAVRAAEGQARADLSKQFEVYTASLMRQYAASTAGGDMTKSSEEQHIEEAVKTFSAMTLSGVQIVDRYEERDKYDRVTIWALARLDIEKFQDLVGKSQELSSAVRDFVRKNAEKAFESLEQEETKRQE